MNLKLVVIFATLFCLTAFTAQANTDSPSKADPSVNIMDEIDPFSPDVEELLNEYDKQYEAETGLSPHLDKYEAESGVPSEFDETFGSNVLESGCFRQSCPVWAQVDKSEQRLYLYLNGQHVDTWLVSTGTSGHGTPNMDLHPNGRIYQAYTSKKWPGGDYKGLGNMPYAVFLKGGFAIHGTGESNWKKLGQRASHGCIRVHPDNGQYFNQLVRQNGIKQVWVTVQD